jgi:hypothetical protein
LGKDLKGKALPDGIIQRSNGSYRGRFQYKGEIYTRDNTDGEMTKDVIIQIQ